MAATPDLLAWLATAMDAAQRDAEQISSVAWLSLALDARARTALAARSFDGATLTAFFEQTDPAAVLRRIGSDRKLIAECEKVLAVDGWEYDDAPNLAEATIRIIAEGYGWTERTTP